MKTSYTIKACILALVLLISNSTRAQNWALLNSTRNFNFAKDRLIYDSLLSVRVTSSSVHNNDSIFQLNRLVIILPYNAAVQNQPNFLQRTAIKHSNGDYYFYDNSAFFIKTLANVGDSWIFDTANSINATVTLVKLGTVLGISDSLKFITLSSGDVITISKEHGLIEFSRSYLNSNKFTLIGMENPNLGVQVPKFNDFFNYQVGDILEYETVYEHNSNTTISDFTQYRYNRYKILSISTIGQTIQLYVERKTKTPTSNGYGNPLIMVYTTDTINIALQNYADHPLNAYRSELGLGGYTDQLTFLTSTASGTKLYKHFHETFVHQSVTDTIYQTVPPYHWLTISYLSGIGLVSYHDEDYNYNNTYDYYDSTLTGGIINGVLYGSLFYDPFFGDAIIGLPPGSINVFPNPVSDEFLIAAAGMGKLEISIFSETGQFVLSRTFENLESINISDRPAGNYIYEIKNETGVLKNGILVKL